jgi:hypothetical protein
MAPVVVQRKFRLRIKGNGRVAIQEVIPEKNPGEFG